MALLCAPPLAARQSEPDVGLARLTALGRLWATIKYFHPGVSDADPGAWDAALLEAIPRVQAARSTEEYGAALRGMLARLDDPLTRISEDVPQLRAASCVSTRARWPSARSPHEMSIAAPVFSVSSVTGA